MRVIGSNVPVPEDTASMALETAIFQEYLDKDFFQEELAHDAIIAGVVKDNLGQYVISNVPRCVVKGLTQGALGEQYTKPILDVWEDLSEFRFEEGIHKLKQLPDDVEESALRYTGVGCILSDPYYYNGVEVCATANQFFSHLSSLESFGNQKPPVYNTADFLARDQITLRAKLRPLPRFLGSLYRELKGMNLMDETCRTIMAGEVSSLRGRMLDIVHQTDAYQTYMDSVNLGKLKHLAIHPKVYASRFRRIH
ncbi:MAG: hypothetical protein JSW08_00590 [archaeon]|nr:MAG: hypothetical protein JSW08_00590 [archaeon]